MGKQDIPTIIVTDNIKYFKWLKAFIDNIFTNLNSGKCTLYNNYRVLHTLIPRLIVKIS